MRVHIYIKREADTRVRNFFYGSTNLFPSREQNLTNKQVDSKGNTCKLSKKGRQKM